MNQDDMGMIFESTFEPSMRRTMERLEEMRARGEKTVTLDINEALHIFGKMVALNQDVLRVQAMLYNNFELLRKYYNSHVQIPLIYSSPEGTDGK